MTEYQEKLKKVLLDQTNVIQSGEIRGFVYYALMDAPGYFWTLKASTSGKYHSGETLVEHILNALAYAQHHVRMLQQYWDRETVDIFYAAVMLHDLFRSGYEGRERTYEDGRYGTDPLHPIYVAHQLQYQQFKHGGTSIIHVANEKKWYSKFAKAVAGHMGPWSPIKECNPMHDNALSLRLHVFLVDYVVSRENIKVDVPEIREFSQIED